MISINDLTKFQEVKDQNISQKKKFICQAQAPNSLEKQDHVASKIVVLCNVTASEDIILQYWQGIYFLLGGNA